jgi:hypothetical protein
VKAEPQRVCGGLAGLGDGASLAPAMRGLSLSVGLLIAGCSNTQAPVELAGRQFCVPDKHIIPTLAWVKVDSRAVRESNGIGIDNCLIDRQPNGAPSKVECLFPSEVGTVSIDEDDGFRSVLGGAGDKESTIGRMVASSDSTHTIVDGGRLLVIANPKIWRSRYIWRRHNGLFARGSKLTAGKDEFLVSCGDTETRLNSPAYGFRPIVACRRKLMSGKLAISYSFEATSHVPSLEEVLQLDRAIVDGLGRVQCDERKLD